MWKATGREADTAHCYAAFAQVLRDVSRPAAEVPHESATGERLGESVQEMPVERLTLELREQVLGVG